MRILFVYDAMYALGGIQTMLVRLTRELQAGGHEVSLLTREPIYPDDYTTELIDELRERMPVHVAEHRYMAKAVPSLRASQIAEHDVIFCCSLSALLLGLVLQRELLPSARLVVGVFGPREYCWESGRKGVDGVISRRVLASLPLTNIVFTTDGMARQTGACAGRNFSTSPVLPIAVDVPPKRTHERPDGRARLVTITRTTTYYPIHWHMLDVVEQLVQRGHDVQFEAYGAGESLDVLRSLAAQRGLGDRVFFRGAIEYARLPDALDGCFAYVGLGTSLLEAAARGVPALVAVDCSTAPTTYGFLHEVPGNDLGGYVPERAEQQIADRLAWLLDVDASRYTEVSDACADRAGEFSTESISRRVVGILQAARPYTYRLGFAARALAWSDWMLWRVLDKLGVKDARGDRYAKLVR